MKRLWISVIALSFLCTAAQAYSSFRMAPFKFTAPEALQRSLEKFAEDDPGQSGTLDATTTGPVHNAPSPRHSLRLLTARAMNRINRLSGLLSRSTA